MERLSDWEQRLNDYLASKAGVRFEWGKDTDALIDCAAFAAGAVEAQTGVDLYAKFRGCYVDEATAMEALKDAGARNLAALVDGMLPRVTRSHAQRGDIILTRDKNLAVCFGATALAVGEDMEGEGLLRVPRHDWLRAYRVG